MKLVVVLLVAIICINVQAWWELGHMTTAQVAKFYLDNLNKTDSYD